MRYRLDINCDMGESFGAYSIGQDSKMIGIVTSANIACGFHAGDPVIMYETVKQAIEKGVAIGAHPGFPDLAGFGRRNMDITPKEVYTMIVYQIGALYGFTQSTGTKIQHVKPHGALYNIAAGNAPLAEAIAYAVYKVNPELILFGLSGSELVKAGLKAGLRTISEAFADRTYQSDGSLTSRRNPNAMIEDTNMVVEQVIRMVKEGKVRSLQGTDVSIQADTICIHGDGPHAFEFAMQIRKSLTNAGIDIKAPGSP